MQTLKVNSGGLYIARLNPPHPKRECYKILLPCAKRGGQQYPRNSLKVDPPAAWIQTLRLYRFWFWCATRSVSAANSPATSVYLSCASSNDTAFNRCFSTSRTSDVAPNLAMAQIFPLTKPLTSAGGNSAHWQSNCDLNPCTPCKHSTTLTISFSCSRVASLSCGFGGVLQNMATQGCFRNVRFATIRLFLDSAVLNPCTKRLRNSLSTLNTINSRNCTLANQLYIMMTACSDRCRPVTFDVTWCCCSCDPACYTRKHHKYQIFVRRMPTLSVDDTPFCRFVVEDHVHVIIFSW